MSFRDGPFNDLKVPLTWTAAVSVIVAIVVGIALLLSDRRETLQTGAYGVGRKVFDVADKPVSGVLSTPAVWAHQISDYLGGYFFAVQENRRLKKQVAALRHWQDVAIALQNTNARYRAVLGFKTDPPIPSVAARVVLDARGPFANTRLANVGSEKGVTVGNPVISDRGLVGRVVGVTRGASRILLLTDVASRTPVLVNRTDSRAILEGDGGSNPQLAYLRGQNPVKEGDLILTSGDGGMFPRGLPVGVAAKGLDGKWRVRLASDLSAIDFVQILEFVDFTALVNEKSLENSALPGMTVGETSPAPVRVGPASSAASAPAKPAPRPARAPEAQGAAPAAAQGTPPSRGLATSAPPSAAAARAKPPANTASRPPSASSRPAADVAGAGP